MLPAGWTSGTISLTGLKGGHSGVDIHLERGNANKLMARILDDLAVGNRAAAGIDDRRNTPQCPAA